MPSPRTSSRTRPTFLPEFKRGVLEVLRQPLEDGIVTISRASQSLTFPAEFMLIASMNPCPCGYFGSSIPNHPCTCEYGAIQRYRSRISGPLLDRIDIHIEVPSVTYSDLASLPSGDSSADIRARVNRARAIQRERYANDGSTKRMFIVQQNGIIWTLDSNGAKLDSFIDLRTKVQYSPNSEQGLLGMAFHPDYQNNGYFYTYYTVKSTNNNNIVRYKVSANPNRAARDSG